MVASMTVLRRATAAGLIGWLAWIGSQALAAPPPPSQGSPRTGRAGPREIRRATPPAAVWDEPTAQIFPADAFAELVGTRPTVLAADQRLSPAAALQPEGLTAAPAGAFLWSALVSEETLTDEIKDMKGLVASAVATPSGFKGGGYDQAREAFSTVALAFGVIAAYDQDIRWKTEAETARDLFARVGFNCKVGTDQSFNEARLRVDDLKSLVEGGPPSSRTDRDEDFRWSQVAGRPALMSRLESAETALAAAAASKADFEKRLAHVLHDSEIVAMIGEVIQQADYEYHDDDTYRGHASAMRDAAIQIREAVKKADYDAARAAVGVLKKSCDACHGAYRG